MKGLDNAVALESRRTVIQRLWEWMHGPPNVLHAEAEEAEMNIATLLARLDLELEFHGQDRRSGKERRKHP